MFGKKKKRLFKDFLNAPPEATKKVNENGHGKPSKKMKQEEHKKKTSSIEGDMSKNVIIKKFDKKDQIPEIDPEQPLKTWIYPLTTKRINIYIF